jgi:hypothetical protein
LAWSINYVATERVRGVLLLGLPTEQQQRLVRCSYSFNSIATACGVVWVGDAAERCVGDVVNALKIHNNIYLLSASLLLISIAQQLFETSSYCWGVDVRGWCWPDLAASLASIQQSSATRDLMF